MEDWERHIVGLKAQAAREPGLPNTFLRLAEAYSQIGDTGHVEEYCRRARDRGAPPAQVHALLGEHYLRLTRFGLALDNLMRALELSPASPAIHVLLWRTLLGYRRLPGQPEPLNPVVLQQAMGLLAARGYYVPLSFRQTGSLFAEDPASARSYLAQGYEALRGAALREALLGFQAAADSSPTLADAYRGMGIVLARLGQTERAFAAYHLFLALEPERTRDVEEVEQIILDFYQRSSARR